MKKVIGLVTVIIFILAGCTNKPEGLGDNYNTKLYFTANIYPGKTFKTNRGSGVYENGRIKKIHRYQVLTRVTSDGNKMIAFTPDHGKDIEVVDLRTNIIEKKFKLEQYPGGFRWFSDKKRIIFEAADKGGLDPSIASNIYLMDLDTMGIRKITDYENVDNRIYAIDLSPDEKKVVYSVAKRGDKLDTVKIIDLETEEEKVLPFSAGTFAWNPSNNKIVLFGIYDNHAGNIEYGSRLIIYDPERNEIVKKYPRDEAYSHMMWMTNSPDGKKIAYVRNENNGALTVWTMDPDGTNHKLVWKPNIFLRDLNWTK